MCTLVITEGPPSIIPKLSSNTFCYLLFGFYFVAVIFVLPSTVLIAFLWDILLSFTEFWCLLAYFPFRNNIYYICLIIFHSIANKLYIEYNFSIPNWLFSLWFFLIGIYVIYNVEFWNTCYSFYIFFI